MLSTTRGMSVVQIVSCTLRTAFLKQAKSENDEKILGLLVEWADELVQSLLDGQDCLTIESATADDLLWKLQPFTYELGGSDGQGVVSPWPLVSVIDFGFQHPLLDEGIVFVDSPGLSDANAARSQNAVKHHRLCTHKIAVAEIGRAEADAALRKNLELGYRTRGSGNTILVLTHGDHIDPDTEVTGTPLEKKRVARLDAEIKDLRAQKKIKGNERIKASAEDREDIDDMLKSISAEMKKLSEERDCCKLEMRNRKVVTEMQKIYRGLTRDPKQLFATAVGNQVYSKYQAGFTADEKPLMSVQQTNIPALRHRLYTMPTEGNYNETLYTAEIQLPALVNSFSLYCSQQHMARKSEIEKILLEPKTEVTRIVKASCTRLLSKVSDTILLQIQGFEGEWTAEARKLCRIWAKRHNGSLQILKKHGYQKANKRSEGMDWNAELVGIGEDTLDEAFREFLKDPFLWGDTLLADLGNLSDGARDKIKHDRQFYTMALDPFLNSFWLRRSEVAKQMNTAERELRRHVSVIHDKAINASLEDFITLAMNPVYDAISQMKGRGGPEKRKKALESALAKRDGVWMQVHDLIKGAFEDYFQQYESRLVNVFVTFFDGLHQDFLRLCADTEVKDEKQKVQEQMLRTRLSENLAEVRKMVAEDGAISGLVEKCKNHVAQASNSQLFVQ